MSTTQFCAETLSGVTDDLLFLQSFFSLVDGYDDSNQILDAIPAIKAMLKRMNERVFEVSEMLEKAKSK